MHLQCKLGALHILWKAPFHFNFSFDFILFTFIVTDEMICVQHWEFLDYDRFQIVHAQNFALIQEHFKEIWIDFHRNRNYWHCWLQFETFFNFESKTWFLVGWLWVIGTMAEARLRWDFDSRKPRFWFGELSVTTLHIVYVLRKWLPRLFFY